MTSQKFHTCSGSLGVRVQSSVPLGLLGWEKFMKHRLKNYRLVLFCFGFMCLFIYLVGVSGSEEADRQSERGQGQTFFLTDILIARVNKFRIKQYDVILLPVKLIKEYCSGHFIRG